MKKSCARCGLVLFVCLVSTGLARAQVAIKIDPTLPADIPNGAPAATLQQAAAFAWQEFIAVNWPALAGQRDTPDTGQKFGAGGGPLVWQTYRSKVEIFNLTKDAAGDFAPPGYSATDANFGYGATPPAYYYATKPVPACQGQTAPPSPAWINLDETTQIGLDQMFAGGPAITDSANTSPQLIRFAVKANHVQYGYVAKNQYYLPGNVKAAAANNVKAYTTHPPVAPNPPFISFPAGTVEIKSA